jgi:2-polyprenyl-3-methyl-5-hydroxy-6-metoxy-1,4-benzoquinol methylase
LRGGFGPPDSVILDRSRQWATSVGSIQKGHWNRYEFACKHVKGRVLDAACGCGYGSRMLYEATNNVVGIDSYELAVEWARTHFDGPEYISGDIETTPLGKFDSIVSLETIEHIKDPLPVLKAFRTACEGSLIVSTPNQESYPFVAEKYAKDSSPHFRHYTPKEFEDLLNEAGFVVKEKWCQYGKIGQVVPGDDGDFLIYVCS